MSWERTGGANYTEKDQIIKADGRGSILRGAKVSWQHFQNEKGEYITIVRSNGIFRISEYNFKTEKNARILQRLGGLTSWQQIHKVLEAKLY